MLADTEMVDVPLDQLEAIGKRDLARNQAALKDACAKYAPGATIEACTKKMQGRQARRAGRWRPRGGRFRCCASSSPATIWSAFRGTEEAKVEESPPYNRQNSAYIDPPGPFDKGIPSVYYISPPDPSWSKQVQQGFIPAKADLTFTTIHEVMPGAFRPVPPRQSLAVDLRTIVRRLCLCRRVGRIMPSR